MRQLNDQRGFVLAVELILLALVVGVIAIVGYQVWQRHQTKPAPQTQTQTTQAAGATPTSSPDANVYLSIKELGAKITLSTSTKSLVYKVHTPTYAMAGVDLGTSDTVGTCGYGYLGAIVKVKGMIPSNVTPSFTTDGNSNRSEYFLKQFDGFYIQHVPAQNGCQLPSGTIFPDKAITDAVIKAVATLQLAN